MKNKKYTEEDIQANLKIIAASRTFIRTQLATQNFSEWSNLQRKIFALILGEIDWTTSNNDNIIVLNNSDVAKSLNWDLGNRTRNIKQVLDGELKFMVGHSMIHLEDPFTGDWYNGNILVNSFGRDGQTFVEINRLFMPHFERLYEAAKESKKPFTTMLESDIIDFKSSFATPLYLELCSCAKRGGTTNHHKLKITELKKIFGLDESAYMTGKDPKTGKFKRFDRFNFEKRVLKPAIEDINSNEMLKILPWEDGSYYKSIKSGRRVVEYEFKYIVLDKSRILSNRLKSLANARTKFCEDSKSELEYLSSLSIDENGESFYVYDYEE